MGAADQVELLRLLEEQRRRQTRDNFGEYCRHIELPGAPLNDLEDCEEFYPDNVTPAKHHDLVIDALQKVGDGDLKRVMFFMPPGSAKSTYGNVAFSTWYMGNHPRENVITTSYGTTLARKFGRKSRQIARSKLYQDLFNTEIARDNQSAEDWSLTNGATYMAGGILSGITGNRAHGLLIDDPVKGREDADSATIRDKVWDAYTSDLRTRLVPGGWVVIIQTRWHEDDLSGRILPADYDGQSGWVTGKDGEPWYVISLQAQCEREDDPLGRDIGEWLWTDWFTPAHWAQEKRTQGERNWSSLFQQRPKPAQGGLIKRRWPQRYKTPPVAFSRIALSLDTAYKPEQINDPSVCGVWGELRSGWYLLHVWRDRVEYPELKRTLANLTDSWKPDAILIEDKASGQSLIQELKATTRLPVIAIDPGSQDKTVRLIAVSPLIEAGRVWLPERADWLVDYESELFGYPLVTNDDQVDMTSQFLKWAHSNSGEIFVDAGGDIRAGYAQDAEDDDFYDDIGGDSSDTGGFL